MTNLKEAQIFNKNQQIIAQVYMKRLSLQGNNNALSDLFTPTPLFLQ